MQIEAQPAGGADARALIAALDAELDRRYPGGPTYGIDVAEFEASGGYFVVAREPAGGVAVGCGAFRPVDRECAEIKRMFVHEMFRGRGIARLVLRHLESVARQRGFRRLILETGILQPEAVRVYETMGFARIPNYGDYVGNPDSICFAKALG